ncbi:MAG: hypothetical protein NVSMB62_23110 [Acidobacteriaceae bacterium]
MKAKCDEISDAGHLSLDCELDAKRLPARLGCVITNRQVSLAAWWDQPSSNRITDGAALHVREFNGPLLLPSEAGKFYVVEAKLLKYTTYKPDLFRTRELGWSSKNSDDIIPSSKLAEEIVLRFLRLVEKRRTNKLEALTF